MTVLDSLCLCLLRIAFSKVATVEARTKGSGTQSHHTRRFELLGDVANGCGRVTEGMKGPNDGAHAAAGNAVRCESVLLKRCQYTDVGEPAGSAPGEHQPEVGSIALGRSGHGPSAQRRPQASSSRSSSR